MKQTLIGRALEGDQGAYEAIYKAYQPRIYGMIAPRTGGRDDVEDLVQMTFIRAFQALGSFRGKAAFSTWLTRIALNVYHSHRRARWAQHERLEEVEDSASTHRIERELAWYEDPEEVVYRKERRALVRKGIQALPAHYREAMWLRYVKDRSYKEIMQELHVPMGTVKTWLCRGRRQLKGEFLKLGVWAV